MAAVQEEAQWLDSNPSLTRSQLGPGRLPASAFIYRPVPGLTRAPLAQTDFISGVASDISEFASTGGSIQPIRPREKTQEGGEIR